jgi:TRAP-type C4-dicarboxylate transport system permease small subunit
MRKLYDYVCAVEAFLARTLLMIMVVLIFGAGLARLVGSPINWALDIATGVFAWACFFCADIAWRRGKLMSVDVLTARLPEKAQLYCRLLNYVVLMGFLVYLVPAGVWLSWISRARSFQGLPQFSYSWVTLSLPVGAILLLVTTTLKFRGELGRTGAAQRRSRPDPAATTM